MIIRTVAFGTQFIGLYFSFAGNVFLVSSRYPKKDVLSKISDVSEVKEVFTDTNLIGIFFAGNSNAILAPFEVGFAKSLNTKYNAYGNLIVANDHGAIISPLLEPLKDDIKTLLGVKHVEALKVADLVTPGSAILANNKGAIVHPAADEETLETIEKTLKVTADYGTIAGSDFVGALAAVSDSIAIVPETIRAPELTIIMETLGIE